MAKNRIGLQFSGFEEVIVRYEKLGGNVKKVAEDALVESQKIISEKSRIAIEPHSYTGDTEKSLTCDGMVTWVGLTAEIGVGFRIRNGGLPSVFLMYGTPRMAKDSKVYNAVYGTSTKKEVGVAQEKIFFEAIDKIMGG